MNHVETVLLKQTLIQCLGLKFFSISNEFLSDANASDAKSQEVSKRFMFIQTYAASFHWVNKQLILKSTFHFHGQNWEKLLSQPYNKHYIHELLTSKNKSEMEIISMTGHTLVWIQSIINSFGSHTLFSFLNFIHQRQ